MTWVSDDSGGDCDEQDDGDSGGDDGDDGEDEQEGGHKDINDYNYKQSETTENDENIVAENMQQRLQRKKAWRRKINFFTGKRLLLKI